MKLRIVASAAIAAASVFAFASAASAQSTTPEAFCAAVSIVNPDPNSTFTSVPSNVSTTTGVEYEQSRTTTSSTPSGVELSRTPAQFVPASEGRNGGSPNIHGEFKSTVTYSGGSLSQTVVFAQDTTTRFGCLVSKTNTKNGNVTVPPGLQVENQSIVSTAVTRTDYVNVSAPNVVKDFFSEGVICNSPGTKRGEWRPQNGYFGTCNTERYLALGTTFVHTNSVPDLAPVNGQPDHSSSSFHNDPMPPVVTDTEWFEDDAV